MLKDTASTHPSNANPAHVEGADDAFRSRLDAFAAARDALEELAR